MRCKDKQVWGAVDWIDERSLGSRSLSQVLSFLENGKIEEAVLVCKQQGRKRRFLDPSGNTVLELELPFWSANFQESEWPIEGRDAFFLFRAGSSALGLCEDAVFVDHKCFQRYVVRGKGKAQASHLKTKGKSRYGSRLRLQNFDRLIHESIGRLLNWEAEGPLQRVFYSCPDRLFSDLRASNPPFPFAKEDPRLRRLPIHVHEPRWEELKRVKAWTERGWMGYSKTALQYPELISRIEFLVEEGEGKC